MLSRNRLTAFDILLYATVVVTWGFAWIAIHFQVGVVPPDVSIVWRFLFAGLLMLGIAAIRKDRLVYSPRRHVTFVVLGLTLFSINFLSFYIAAETLPSGLLSIVFSLASLINVGLGALMLKAPIDRRVVAGGLLGVIGMTAMFYPQFAGTQFHPATAVALALCIFGTVVFCLGNMASVPLQREGISVFASSGYGMLYGSAALAIYAALQGHSFAITWTAPYLGALLYLIVIASIIAYASYLTLLGRIGADRAAYVSVLGPAIALAVSTLVEGFQWTLPTALGLVAVLAGNVLVLRPGKKAVDASASETES